MKAIGIITAADATGKLSVKMFYGGKWQSNWSLSNKMPANHPEFGVFSFQEGDQFCEWVDPDELRTQDDVLEAIEECHKGEVMAGFDRS